MKLNLTASPSPYRGCTLCIERTETDKPVVPRPYPRPEKVTPGQFNSWRKTYPIFFDTMEKGKRAFAKCEQLADFDMAAAWLDKQ